jgi:hypothetical protein
MIRKINKRIKEGSEDTLRGQSAVSSKSTMSQTVTMKVNQTHKILLMILRNIVSLKNQSEGSAEH